MPLRPTVITGIPVGAMMEECCEDRMVLSYQSQVLCLFDVGALGLMTWLCGGMRATSGVKP